MKLCKQKEQNMKTSSFLAQILFPYPGIMTKSSMCPASVTLALYIHICAYAVFKTHKWYSTKSIFFKS